jgi:hypothetical protein
LRPSTEIIPMLDNIGIDVAIIYLDAEAVNRVIAIPLYSELYRLPCAGEWSFATRGERRPC